MIESMLALGFRREEAERSVAMVTALGWPPTALYVAADLARYVRVPLDDAVGALMVPRRLRRLGIPVGNVDQAAAIEYVRPIVRGQAAAYAETMLGKLDILEATSGGEADSFVAACRAILARYFGTQNKG